MKRCQRQMSKRKCKRFTFNEYCWQHKIQSKSYLSSVPRDLILELGLFLPYNDVKLLCDNMGDLFWTRYYSTHYSPIYPLNFPTIKCYLDQHVGEYDNESDNFKKFIIAATCGWTIKLEKLLPFIELSDNDWHACVYAFGIVPRHPHMIDFFLSKVKQCRDHIFIIMRFCVVAADLSLLDVFKKHIADKNIYNDMLKWLTCDVLNRMSQYKEIIQWLVEAGADINMLTLEQRQNLYS